MSVVEKKLYDMIVKKEAGRASDNTRVFAGSSMLHVFFHGNEIFRLNVETGDFTYDFCGYEHSPVTMGRINCCLEAAASLYSLCRRNHRVLAYHHGTKVMAEVGGRMDNRDVLEKFREKGAGALTK